eukprot:9239528-Pyramimonas_sp.AAC.1
MCKRSLRLRKERSSNQNLRASCLKICSGEAQDVFLKTDVTQLRSKGLVVSTPPPGPGPCEVTQPATPTEGGYVEFECPVCRGSFISQRALVAHMNRVCARAGTARGPLLEAKCKTNRVPHAATIACSAKAHSRTGERHSGTLQQHPSTSDA